MVQAPANKAAKPKATAYDVAEQLHTPKEMAVDLAAWLGKAPADVAGISALGDIAKANGMPQRAKNTGLSHESHRRGPSADSSPRFATVLKLTKVLGICLPAQAAASET